MKAIEKDGYLYDPPSWKVCDECGGIGLLGTPESSYSEYPDECVCDCGKCHGDGLIPIHYTPQEWKAAGGILTNGLPVWARTKPNGRYTQKQYRTAKQYNYGNMYVATSVGPPEEEKHD